ncbi:MAG: FecR domain-containing protein [Alphaproteobacteria bacterium]|nr:FecR domain-containing protein [Alphaproteobacteria bacterium]
MFKSLAFAAALFLLSPSLSFAAAPAPEGIIGTILEVEGAGTVTQPGKQPVAAAVKTRVHMNDVIATGPKGRIFILFIDNTQFTLSENSKLKVDKYVFDPQNPAVNKGTFNVMQGAFKYTSGQLAKKKDPDVSINTPYGNIGVRGTVVLGGRVKDAYGVHVQEGRVQVRNDAGAVLVDKGNGTMIKSRAEKPSNQAPFPPELLNVLQTGVFLIAGDQLMKNLPGFMGENLKLQEQFKSFQQLNGLLPGGGNLPIPGVPGGDNPVPKLKGPGNLLKKFPF